MCLSPPKIAPQPVPAQRQAMKQPETADLGDPNALRRRRGYSALISTAAPSLQPPMTTAGTLGG